MRIRMVLVLVELDDGDVYQSRCLGRIIGREEVC